MADVGGWAGSGSLMADGVFTPGPIDPRQVTVCGIPAGPQQLLIAHRRCRWQLRTGTADAARQAFEADAEHVRRCAVPIWLRNFSLSENFRVVDVALKHEVRRDLPFLSFIIATTASARGMPMKVFPVEFGAAQRNPARRMQTVLHRRFQRRSSVPF